MAKTHMSLGSLQGAAAPAALLARVSLAHDRARDFTPARHFFSTYH